MNINSQETLPSGTYVSVNYNHTFTAAGRLQIIS